MVKRVLVGIDFSEASRQVLEQASQWARRLGVPLTALHVVAAPDPILFSAYASMSDPSWFHSIEPNAQKVMDQWLAPYPDCRGLIHTGNPAKCLVDRSDADTLLVVGHKGHGALDAFHLGSTADRVIRRAAGDVLVVRVAKG
jgi:nucleotide-binding universal stress UspA family protein